MCDAVVVVDTTTPMTASRLSEVVPAAMLSSSGILPSFRLSFFVVQIGPSRLWGNAEGALWGKRDSQLGKDTDAQGEGRTAGSPDFDRLGCGSARGLDTMGKGWGRGTG